MSRKTARTSARKTVGIIGTLEINAHGTPSQRAANSYPLTVARMLEATPLIIPSLPEVHDIGHLVEILDGVVLTGARPNVHPEEYGEAETLAHAPFDRGRDRVAIDLVRAAVDTGLPLFGICRGFQEMNVAYGGALHPEIRDLPGRMNHRMPKGETDPAVVYRPRHKVSLIPDGTFAGIYGTDEIEVNSLHGQGITTPGDRIIIEGVAEDTTPEALRIADAPGFALGVQWHAEFDPARQPGNAPLWQAFRSALDHA